MEIIKSKLSLDSRSIQHDNVSRGTIKLVIAKSNDGFQEARCTKCHRLLFKVKGLHKGQIEVKCGKCGTLNNYN